MNDVVKSDSDYLSDLENLRGDAIATYREILDNPVIDAAQKRMVAADILDRTNTYRPKSIDIGEIDARLGQALGIIAVALSGGLRLSVDLVGAVEQAKKSVMRGVNEDGGQSVEYEDSELVKKISRRDEGERNVERIGRKRKRLSPSVAGGS